MSNVRTVPSTLPAIISVFVKQTDMTLSEKVLMICKSLKVKLPKQKERETKIKKKNRKKNSQLYFSISSMSVS